MARQGMFHFSMLFAVLPEPLTFHDLQIGWRNGQFQAIVVILDASLCCETVRNGVNPGEIIGAREARDGLGF